MNPIFKYFLDALKASLHGEAVSWDGVCQADDLRQLVQLSSVQMVLPMIYEAVGRCPDWQKLPPQEDMQIRMAVIRAAAKQAAGTQRFLKMYGEMSREGLTPLVVKGIICRNLYPNPDERISSDEDLCVAPEQLTQVREFLEQNGFVYEDAGQTEEHMNEFTYRRSDGLYLEVHKRLFAEDSSAYGDWERFFADAHDRKMSVQIEGTDVFTMNETDHFFYLICHAFKHFLHSGVGIRQICDILLFSQNFGSDIDWKEVYNHCREIRADVLTATFAEIGVRYLGFSAAELHFPEEWLAMHQDPDNLIGDLLEAGVYGLSSPERAHSSNITLSAKKGGASGRTADLLYTVFPSREVLINRYPYLQKHRWMLFFAWISRIFSYYKGERSHSGNNAAAKTLEIGEKRVELLRQYKVIDE